MKSDCDTKNLSGAFCRYLDIIFQKEENMEGKRLNEKEKRKQLCLNMSEMN